MRHIFAMTAVIFSMAALDGWRCKIFHREEFEKEKDATFLLYGVTVLVVGFAAAAVFE